MRWSFVGPTLSAWCPLPWGRYRTFIRRRPGIWHHYEEVTALYGPYSAFRCWTVCHTTIMMSHVTKHERLGVLCYCEGLHVYPPKYLVTVSFKIKGRLKLCFPAFLAICIPKTKKKTKQCIAWGPCHMFFWSFEHFYQSYFPYSHVSLLCICFFLLVLWHPS